MKNELVRDPINHDNHINSLQIQRKQSKEWCALLYFSFVDVETEFDQLCQQTMCQVLRYFKIPQKIIILIEILYATLCSILHKGFLKKKVQDACAYHGCGSDSRGTRKP